MKRKHNIKIIILISTMNFLTHHNINKLITNQLSLGDILQLSLVSKQFNKISKSLLREKYTNINIKKFDPKKLLKFGCKNGDISLVKYIITNHDISKDYKQGCFKQSCKSGNLEIAKWLYSLGIINIDDDKMVCDLSDSSIHIHLNVSKWILSLFKIVDDYNFQYKKVHHLP